jgi:tRNA 2-selenouridine synthase
VQQWLREAGIEYPLVRGGYKAMRRFLLDEFERSVARVDLVLVSGKTGTGKTRVIQRLFRSIDLEGLANHRGSTFGQLPEPQPSQIDFENALSIAFLKQLDRQENAPIFLEDEGRLIGRICLPDALRLKMSRAPMLVVEEPFERRVDVVIQDYVLDLGKRYVDHFGPEGARLHSEKLQQDLLRIRKRLGGERHRQVSELMAGAFEAQQESGDPGSHRGWIALLLARYYDPMYEYQLSRRQGEQLFNGNREEVIGWAASRWAASRWAAAPGQAARAADDA